MVAAQLSPALHNSCGCCNKIMDRGQTLVPTFLMALVIPAVSHNIVCQTLTLFWLVNNQFKTGYSQELGPVLISLFFDNLQIFCLPTAQMSPMSARELLVRAHHSTNKSQQVGGQWHRVTAGWAGVIISGNHTSDIAPDNLCGEIMGLLQNMSFCDFLRIYLDN